MPGNIFGKIFTITTFGESHGKAIGVVIDGIEPGMPLSAEDIQVELDRRRPGQSFLTTQRSETDRVEILSGLFDGCTTGTPMALLIKNKDAKSEDYQDLKDVFRPGHADFTYFKKYGIRDWRGSGRASGRETAMRVAAGAIAKKILAKKGVTVTAYVKEIGGIKAESIDFSMIDKNPVRCPDLRAAEIMATAIEDCGKKGDSLGGVIEAVVKGCPAGLGDPVFDKLDARLSHAIISIGAINGIEFGDGFSSSLMKGSEFNDSFISQGEKITTSSNHCGGISGGISNGNDILLRVSVRPTSSISIQQKTVSKDGASATIQIHGRHDPCVCPRAVVVVEAMIAITLLDCLLIQESIRPHSTDDAR